MPWRKLWMNWPPPPKMEPVSKEEFNKHLKEAEEAREEIERRLDALELEMPVVRRKGGH